ncbi:MAG: hypothetical protein HZA84_06115 [Thaumarchaeota archaeon]|nr:hypothetical protein [Nitrososphaerota archaeon]
MIKIASQSLEFWEKRLIERFIERSDRGTFELKNKLDLFKSFGRFKTDPNLSKAFDNLIYRKLILQINLGNYILNSHTSIAEIRRILQTEPIPFMSEQMMPVESYFEGYTLQFNFTTDKNSWPHRGTYYCCTKNDDPSTWKIIFRANPAKKPTSYSFGSLLDNDSKIIRMWKTVLKVWEKYNREPIYKKQAEDINQTDFENNRQPGAAAFALFIRFGWIHEVGRKGKQVFYQIDKPEEHLDLIKKRIPICPRCGIPAPDRFCVYCNLPVS